MSNNERVQRMHALMREHTKAQLLNMAFAGGLVDFNNPAGWTKQEIAATVAEQQERAEQQQQAPATTEPEGAYCACADPNCPDPEAAPGSKYSHGTPPPAGFRPPPGGYLRGYKEIMSATADVNPATDPITPDEHLVRLVPRPSGPPFAVHGPVTVACLGDACTGCSDPQCRTALADGGDQ